MRPLDEVLDDLRGATRHLLQDVDQLTDRGLHEPSLLAGWTRGHVVTHLAQNADAGVRLLSWARTGVRHREYASVSSRDAAVREGARRPSAVQMEHLRRSADAFASACAAMTGDHWEQPVTWTTGEQTPADVVVRSRLTEVLVHHVDLDIDFRPAAWPPRFVRERLESLVSALNRRHLSPQALRVEVTDTGCGYVLEASADVARTVSGAEVDILAWLLGRSRGEGLCVSDGRPLPMMPSTYTT